MEEKKQSKLRIIIIILILLLAFSLIAFMGTLLYGRFGTIAKNKVAVKDNIITSIYVDTEAASISGGINAEATIELSTKHTGDNEEFNLVNMMPGDVEAKYYCIKVKHKKSVVLKLHADIQDGSDKLSEVMKCKVEIPEKGIVLYDGLMAEMPESLNYSLGTDKEIVSEVYYKVSVYLETSVGSEYAQKELISNFRWWIEDMANE